MLDFQKNFREFEEKNIRLVAASVDPLEKASETVRKYKLAFKVGYGLDPRQISALTGAFYDAKDAYVQATGFVINPESKIANAVYSSNSIGRLNARDCMDFVGH